MCGIAGWFSQGKKRPSPAVIEGLLLANQERGISAAGVAWRDGDKIRVRKSQGPAQDFLKANPALLKEMVESPIGLLHARATTKGSEKQEENNHPVVGFDWAVTHNGTITNDDDLWEYYEKKLKIERFADVDTSVIPLVLNQGKTLDESINNLTLIAGTATLAAWSGKHIDRILLARKGQHDLHMFLDEKDDILYWSSSGAASYVMRGTTIGRHKFMPFTRLADDHVLLLQPGGWDKTRVFKLDFHPFYMPLKPTTSTGSEAGAKGSSGTPSGKSSTPTKVVGFHGRESHPALGTSISGVASGIKTSVVDIVKGHRMAKVEIETPGHRQMSVSWNPIDDTVDRPWPMTTTFTTDWWNLPKEIRKLQLSSAEESERSSAYGRWIIKRPESVGNPFIWTFKPYKRVKEWMEDAYRTKIMLPRTLEEYNGKMVTEYDTHWAWEHYNLSWLKEDGTTGMALGFCCPWCGVWQSTVQVQHNNMRCEFCQIENRLVTGYEKKEK